MDILLIIGVILFLAAFLGTILSFINLSSISSLKSELRSVSNTIKLQGIQIKKLLEAVEHLKVQRDRSSRPKDDQPALGNALDVDEIIETNPTVENQKIASISSSENDDVIPVSRSSVTITSEAKIKASFSLETFLMGNGLLWVGAIVLALGGVFLAKYSIEAGIFPPGVRIVIGVCFGLILVGAAEYLYRYPKRFQINSSMISAALASGGVITCFSMTLVAFDFYAFLSPLLAFAVLALISITATWLSVRFGPILALVGVVGAYVVPALVSTGSNNVFTLLLYVAFVSLSTLWVHAIVKQSWLWWLSVVGHFGWLFISIFISENNYDWVIFTYCLVSIYLYVLVPITGWKLNHTSFDSMPIKSLLMPRKEQLGIVLPVLALVLLFIARPFETDILIMLPLLSALLLIAPYRHSAFDTWPFIALCLCLLTFLKMPITYDYLDNLFPFTGAYLLVQVSSIAFVVYSMFAISIVKDRPSYLLLLVLAPILLMGLSYALSEHDASLYLYSVWSIELMIISVVFAFIATRTTNILHKMTYFMLANGALTLTFTMLLSASTLTLAIISQIALMAYLSHQYRLLLPSWLYKIAIGAVMLRLTAAPWLSAYMNETILGVHWSLIVYPIAFSLLFLAKSYQKESALKAWFTGSMLHLIALFITTETSYLIEGSYPNLLNLSYEQSILLSMNWLILGAVYLWRRQTTRLQSMYLIFSVLLISASGILQLYLSIIQNPFIVYQNTGTSTFINWLFPLWAVPAFVLLAMVYGRLVADRFRLPIYCIANLLSVFYINGLIRTFYHEALSFTDFKVGQQELYVYSIVWLIISIGLIVAAQTYKKENINKVGFGVLAVVILKAFLVDLSSLEGLYRALSFIGLGLSLVSIGWLFQRFSSKTVETTNNSIIKR